MNIVLLVVLELLLLLCMKEKELVFFREIGKSGKAWRGNVGGFI